MFAAFNRYFELEGRSTRREFWGFMALNFVVCIVLLIGLVFAIGGQEYDEDASLFAAILGNGTGLFIFILMLFWVLITFVPNVTVTVRRLHDQGRSGFWYLGYLVLSWVPLLNIVASLGFLVLMLLPGTRGDNAFGSDPRDSGWGGAAYATSAF